MCRDIRALFNFEALATEEEIPLGPGTKPHKKLCGSTSISSLMAPGFFGGLASHARK